MTAPAGFGGLPPVAMTRLDRAIATVAPRYALRRLESRVRLEMASVIVGPGGYNGARTDRQALKNWQPGNQGPNAAYMGDIRPLRARAGDALRNDPVAVAGGNAIVTSTVGVGVLAHARVDREYLGLDTDAADALDRQIDRVVNAHAESEAWDLEGRSDFYSQQGLILRSVLGRGDVLVVRRWKPRKGALLATCFQVIEADRVSTRDSDIPTPKLIDGVVMDDDGEAVAYWVQDQHPGEYRFAQTLQRTWTLVEAKGVDSGLWKSRLVYVLERPTQARGVPILAPVMEVLKQVSRLTEAELMASVVNALFAVFVKTNGAGSGLPDMLVGAPGMVGQQPTPIKPQDPRQLNLGNGIVVKLEPDEEIQLADPKRPNALFDPFFVAMVQQVGAAIEVPIEVLLKRFNGSYSASRGAMLEFWRAVTMRRRWLVAQYAAPARAAVIEEAVARGLIVAPRFFTDPLARLAYCRADWTGPAMGQLNPLDEANAADKRVNMGVTTLAEETAQMTGGNWEQKHPQRVKEHAMRAEAGLEPAILSTTTRATVTEPAQSPPAPPANPPADDADEQEARHAA